MHLWRYDLYVRPPAAASAHAAEEQRPFEGKAKRTQRRGKGAERASERRRPRGCERGRRAGEGGREGEEGWMMLYCFELVMLRRRACASHGVCASAVCIQLDPSRAEKILKITPKVEPITQRFFFWRERTSLRPVAPAHFSLAAVVVCPETKARTR